MCTICAGSLVKNGQGICIDGNPVLANDYPDTGGPWVLAWQAGQPVWFNLGGL